MFPKCSMDVPNIATLREHSENIPGVLLAAWAISKKQSQFYALIIFFIKILKINTRNTFYRNFRRKKF